MSACSFSTLALTYLCILCSLAGSTSRNRYLDSGQTIFGERPTWLSRVNLREDNEQLPRREVTLAICIGLQTDPGLGTCHEVNSPCIDVTHNIANPVDRDDLQHVSDEIDSTGGSTNNLAGLALHELTRLLKEELFDMLLGCLLANESIQQPALLTRRPGWVTRSDEESREQNMSRHSGQASWTEGTLTQARSQSS